MIKHYRPSLSATRLFLLLSISLVAVLPLPLAAWDNKIMAKNCLNKAVLAMQHNQYSRALPYLNQAVQLDPGNAEAQLFLGQTKYELDMTKEAILNLTEGLKLRPDCREEVYYMELGQSLFMEGKPREAIAIFSKGIAKIPKSTGLLCERGCTLAMLALSNQALADLNRAIKMDPKIAHLYRQRAMIYMGMHQYAQAIKDSTTQIALNPGSPMPYAERASIYRAMGKLDLAAKDLDKSRHLGLEDF